MFSTSSWLALATTLLACAVVLCEARYSGDNCAFHQTEKGSPLRSKSSYSIEDFKEAIDNYKREPSSTRGLQDYAHHPNTPFKWEVKKTNLVTSDACTATQTTATHTERCRGEEITWSFVKTRASTPNWRSTITEETYTRITGGSNTTIITVTDKIWADDIEDTHVTETVFTDFEDDRKVSRDMTWGSQKNRFVGDGTVPCDATVWRLSIGYRGTGYDAQKDCVCAAYVENCSGGDSPSVQVRNYERQLPDYVCPPTCAPIEDEKKNKKNW